MYVLFMTVSFEKPIGKWKNHLIWGLIAIEAPWGVSIIIDWFQKFLKGDLEPLKAEEEQIGFRLAKLLGHKTIYPIDVKLNLDDTELSKLIQSDPAKFGPYLSILEKPGMELLILWVNG